MTYRLSPLHDRRRLHAEFAGKGRIHIPDLLEAESAARLGEAIARVEGWHLVLDNKGKHYDLDAAGMRAAPADLERVTQIARGQAQQGFAYLFENCPIYDLYHAGRVPDHPLASLFEFLNGTEFLGFVRAVTGFDAIGFADAQATRYGPGHFLTSHNDAVEGKNRLAAYVLNMTPAWKRDWGGHLVFYDAKGDIEHGYAPAFNALNIFAVPADHAVSYVAPFAGAKRLSITGWLRAGADPKRA
jgi:Rps23 Pro-64 3,4-dihydroxylase Tpa1-like proline 4-hydroxylase